MDSARKNVLVTKRWYLGSKNRRKRRRGMKKFTVVLLAGILAMGLAGCSLETEKAPEEQTSVSVAG